MDKFDYNTRTNFEECIKCTVCTVYCPVTNVNPLFPGPKQAGPDSERYRLKKSSFYDDRLRYCLNCKRCEVACPSNVRIGDIIQRARLKYDTSKPSVRDRILSNTDRTGRLASRYAPIVNGMLQMKPVKKLLEAGLRLAPKRTFPKYASTTFSEWYHNEAEEAQLKFPKTVTYFHGCYVEYNYPQLGKDLIKVMNSLGYGVRLLEEEKCCGVTKISNGMMESAIRDAKINLSSIRAAIRNGLGPIVATSSTCTLTIRDAYTNLLGLDNRDIRDNVMLATRFIYRLIEDDGGQIPFLDRNRLKIAYHIPCHAERLGWSIYTTELLRMIPGVELLSLEPNCCGIAGTYGFKKENYDSAQRIGQPLFDEIESINADVVATDCETCKWQIEMSTSSQVQHPISILADSIG